MQLNIDSRFGMQLRRYVPSPNVPAAIMICILRSNFLTSSTTHPRSISFDMATARENVNRLSIQCRVGRLFGPNGCNSYVPFPIGRPQNKSSLEDRTQTGLVFYTARSERVRQENPPSRVKLMERKHQITDERESGEEANFI